MLVSMTGFGHAEVSNRSARVSVEIRTVNHRYFDVSSKFPKALLHREHEIKELLKQKISRGRISISITAETELPKFNVAINLPLMEQYVAQLRKFANKHSLPTEIDINTLAGLPEVFELQENQNDADVLWPLVKKGTKQALAALVKMREDEGKALEADIRSRITRVNKLIKKVERRAPKVQAHHTKALKERVAKLMEGVRVDRDRWMTEVALLADRLDFTEETTRLNSHMAQFKACLDRGGPVSKKLTYLLQEIHREGTTISSKAADAEVVEHMVSLKEETEKLREQVQNLE
ncbi:MAG: YicC family protein [Candidatus Latescibacterota bacterium]|nr:MAG: YicC family protein [Candidatus Latescibacterota bacterium]